MTKIITVETEAATSTMDAWRHIPEQEFLAKLWQQEEDRYVEGIEAYRNRIDRWLIAAIVAMLTLLLLAGSTMAYDDASARGRTEQANRESGRGTVNNPFDGPTQGLRGMWQDNQRSLWAAKVSFGAWLASWRAMPDCCQNRVAIVAERYDYTPGTWSVHTAGRGYWHGVD